MIGAAGLETDGDLRCLSFRRAPLSAQSGRPVLIGIGDPVSGPLIGLFYDAPSSEDQLVEPPDLTPAHSHPCDNFRVVMKGELWVGKERYHHGEFRLQRTGTPYGRDGDAPHRDGNWRIILFADRRGHRVRPTNRQLRASSSTPEAFAATKERFGALLPEILPDSDDGVEGLVTTIDKRFSRLGHIDASFAESGEWTPVGDDRRLAVSLLGAHEVGPVILLQRTAPRAEATPAFRVDSDVFRCVVRGTAHTAAGTLEMGDTVVRSAGELWEPVLAGPDGLDELIVIGDRSGGTPQVAADDVWASGLDRILGILRSRLGAPADA